MEMGPAGAQGGTSPVMTPWVFLTPHQEMASHFTFKVPKHLLFLKAMIEHKALVTKKPDLYSLTNNLGQLKKLE